MCRFVDWIYQSDNNFNFLPLGSFCPFYILAKIQTVSGFEPKFQYYFRKKDNFEDKKRIKRINFLKPEEVAKT